MRILLIALITAISLPTLTFAKSETLYSSFKYTMGDNDTKNDARRVAFMEAKRRLIEKAGVYIESETTVENSSLSKDEIRSFSAALIKVEVEKEDFQITGDSQTITTTVKAEVDSEEIARTLKKIREDKSLQAKIKEQQASLKEMEKRINNLQSELVNADTEKAVKLRRERAIAFQKMGDLEKIKFTIQNATQTALQVVERGMTPDEVKKVAGSPRSEHGYWSSTMGWNYGNVWVVFEGRIVRCLVDGSTFSTIYGCNKSLVRVIK